MLAAYITAAIIIIIIINIITRPALHQDLQVRAQRLWVPPCWATNQPFSLLSPAVSCSSGHAHSRTPSSEPVSLHSWGERRLGKASAYNPGLCASALQEGIDVRAPRRCDSSPVAGPWWHFDSLSTLLSPFTAQHQDCSSPCESPFLPTKPSSPPRPPPPSHRTGRHRDHAPPLSTRWNPGPRTSACAETGQCRTSRREGMRA